MDNPVYDYGRGPINVKVVDPLNVADGYYECIFEDYNTSITNGADTALWTINRYASEGGSLLGSVSSEVAISTNNEQIIPQWGVSVQINQELYYLPEGATGGPDARTTDLLEANLNFADSSKRWLSGVPDNDAFYPTNWIRSGDYTPVNPDDCIPAGAGYTGWIDPCQYPDEIGIDADKTWANILGGTVAPHRLVGYQASYMPMAYFNYAAPTAARKNASISFLPSVDIVMTPDKSKWTRCPVIELGRESTFNVGNAEPGEMRKSPSVDKNGNPDNSGTTGMGWFPGYAIDIESGVRLYMAFGENSFLVTDNGADMLWNPTERLTDDNGNPIMGGMHPVYVWSYAHKSKNDYVLGYDYTEYIPSDAGDVATHVLYNDMLAIEGNDVSTKRNVYGSISWVAYPLLAPTMDLLSTEATLSLRVNKEYKDFSNRVVPTGGPNGGKPMYSWNMSDIRTETGSADALSDALSLINVVPNPYKAYAEYEKNRLDTRVKITNLPERCNIKIYNTQGKLIKTFIKDSPTTFQDWLLVNHKGIPVASGVYLIHVEVPDIGEVIIKSFVSMRQVDLHGL